MHKKLWISLTSVCGFLTVLMVISSEVAKMYKTQIDVFLDVPTYKTVETSTEEKEATYFKSSFDSDESRTAAEDEICAEIEGEGAVLLKNEDKTLPLATNTKFSVFSTSSVDPVYSGTGSGHVDSERAVTLRSALNAEFGKGCSNPSLLKKYLSDLQDYRRVNPILSGGKISDFKINEAPWNLVMTDEVRASMPNYGDCALVVLARSGGEGNDTPISECSDAIEGDFLRLNQDEIDMLHGIKELKDQGVVKKIVVLLNGSNCLKLDFVDDSQYGIDACAWIGDVGTTGMTAVTELLSGKRNFSGRLSETFLKDHFTSPVMANFGLQSFTNSSVGTGEYDTGYVQHNDKTANCNKCNQNYIVYQEGIYVGYRYYETRYADYVLNKGNPGDFKYSNEVAYPFGFGESYTDWTYSDFSIKEDGDKYYASVKVTNSGEVSGKNAVELYFSSPYTDYDKENNIEKSAVSLAGYTKTNQLEPGQSEKVEIKMKKKDLTSYDSNKAKTYILDAGDYYFTIGKNAHDANNNILQVMGGDKTKMDSVGDESLVYKKTIDDLDIESYSISEHTGYKITNAFDHADLNKYEGTSTQKITYLSRNDWVNTFPTTNVKLKITNMMWTDGLTSSPSRRKEIVKEMEEKYYPELVNSSAPTMNKAGDLQLIQYRELDLNKETDEKWKMLVEQANYADMTEVVYNGIYQINKLTSIGMPTTACYDGPQGYSKPVVGNSKGMAYTSEDIIASSRNNELVKKLGEFIGEDCLAATATHEISSAGLYAPGCNIHRSPYGGRNYEYYSEDPLLSSVMCQYEVKGLKSKGVIPFEKHFALNDQEAGRYGVSTWANEQSIREIYLKPFEESVANQNSSIMSSFNRLGVIWAGADYSLMTTVLRDEWGAKGASISDCSLYCTYMDPACGMIAGQNFWCGNASSSSIGTDEMRTLDGCDNDPVMVTKIQESVKHICFASSKSLAMNGISSTTKIVSIESWYLVLLRYLAIGFGVLTIGFGGLIVYDVVKGKKEKKIKPVK